MSWHGALPDRHAPPPASPTTTACPPTCRRLAGDAAETAALLAELSKSGCVRCYQPYKEGKEGADGEHGQPLVIMLQTRFQARMLDQFGGRMAMLDATFGTNKYGYPLTALLVSGAGTKYLPAGCPAPGCAHCSCCRLPAQVQDEQARGVPVGFMISSGEDADLCERFLREMQKGVSGVGPRGGAAGPCLRSATTHRGSSAQGQAGSLPAHLRCATVHSLCPQHSGAHLQAREHGGGDFKYGYIMVDKSATEIAAIKQLVSTGDAKDWQLCYFHFLQGWERFLRTRGSGAAGAAARHQVIVALAALVHTTSEALFQSEVGGGGGRACQRPHATALACPCSPHQGRRLPRRHARSWPSSTRCACSCAAGL